MRGEMRQNCRLAEWSLIRPPHRFSRSGGSANLVLVVHRRGHFLQDFDPALNRVGQSKVFGIGGTGLSFQLTPPREVKLPLGDDSGQRLIVTWRHRSAAIFSREQLSNFTLRRADK